MSEEIGIKVTLIPDYSKLEAQLQKKKVRLIVDTSNVSAQLSKELKAYKPKVTISSIQVANKDKALESLSKQLSRVKIVIDGSNVKVKKASIQKAIQNAISGTTNFQFQQTVKSQSKPQSTLNLKTGYNALRSAEAALSRIPQSDGNFVGSVSDSAAHLQRLTSELRTFFNLADGQSISDILSIDPTTITNYDQVLAKITQVRDATIQLQRDSSAKGAAQTYENSIKTEIKRYETLITEMQNYLSDNPRVTSSGYGTSVQQYISEARLAIQALETKNAPQTAAKDLATNFQSLKNNAHDAGLEVENAYVSITRLFKSHMGTAIATAGVLALKQAMQQVIQTVIELDGAITNLRMVTGSSKSETADLVKGYTGMGEELGATTLDIATSANEWLRQGYTLEETNQLIRASMILSKVGMIESGEATKYLTSALKGYKLSAEDAISVVDKLSTVDMEAATSAGGLALAMSRTAASADLSGVSMDKLLGYIAVVAETTQKAEESVGESFKGLFARMGNIKAGRLTDPETEEDLSDVEATLGGLGIKLRDSDSEFRNFGDVLDEVAGKWNEYSSVQKRALSVAFAGTRRQEDFIVLMENYGNAIKYAESSMNSAGTSEQKYDAYLESTEAHLNKFNVAFESL